MGPLPGETPLDDISGLIPKHVRNRAQLNEAEGENILDTLTKYLGAKPDKELAPFDLRWCYQLHGEMLGRVWRWAGAKRTHNLNLGVEHYLIDVSLQGLLDDLRYWESAATLPFSEQAARLHHRAVSIHPFANGNGRWSRLLANIWLAQHEEPVVLWPESVIGTTNVIRDAYLQAIRAADAGDLHPLVQMHDAYSIRLEN